jgi:uncharacterized protein
VPSCRQFSRWTAALILLCWSAACSRQSAPTTAADAPSDPPFDIRDVTFDSSSVSLSGRLFAPRRPHSNYPVAVYVTGSGDDDVIESGYPRDLAKVFAASGIGLFVYNKRGVGKSQGTYSNSRFAERAQDTVAALGYVQSLPGVDSAHVGLWGISQGGWVIAMAAGQASRQANDVAFVILVSPAGLNPKRQMDFYLQNEWRRAEMNDGEIKQAAGLHDILFQYYSNGKNYQQAQAAVDDAKKAGWLEKYRQANFREEVPKTGRLPAPAELAALNHKDPSALDFYHAPSIVADYYPNYLQLTMPALIIYGGRDIFVPVSESMAVFKKAFAENRNQQAEVKMFAEGDHGITSPGSPDVLLPGYPEFMRDWIWKTIQQTRDSR